MSNFKYEKGKNMKKIVLAVALVVSTSIFSIAESKELDLDKNDNNPYNLSEMIKYNETNFQKKKIFETKEFEIILFAFTKKQGLKAHSTPFDSFLQILDGEVIVTIGKEVFNLKKGDVIKLVAEIPHKLEAKTDFKMLLTKKIAHL